MQTDPVVLLDANVLAESAISDLLLRLAEESRLLSSRWTAEIWREVRRTLIDKLGWPANLADSRIAAAQTAFSEAMVSDFEGYIEQCTNDPKDRHILAAAIHANAEKIVTLNARHFKDADLARWNISAIHPDKYLRVLYDLDEGVVNSVLHRMAEVRNRSPSSMLSRLSAGMPSFCAPAAFKHGLEVPPFSPASWRR